jgi:hypothetical protein
MHTTRREFLDDFLGFVNELHDPNARDVASRLLNRVVTRIWMKHPWRAFRSPAPVEITTVANQRSYALPDYFGRVGPGRIRNLTTGGSPIEPLEAGDAERAYPVGGTSLETASTPRHCEIAGVAGVHTQPAPAGEALEVLSDSASDTDVVVTVAGDDSSGRWTRTQVTLNGTTAVAIGTWGYLDEMGKAYVNTVDAPTSAPYGSSRGTVTLRKVSNQAELQKLLPQESAREHALVTFYPKPSGAWTMALPCIRKVKRLYNDADPLPDLWEPAILEEMHIEWQVNTGEMPRTIAGQVPRPAFLDLLVYDHELARGGAASWSEPFR